MQNWELVPVTASLMCIILLAARYAKRPDITHRFAKFLESLFVTFSIQANTHPNELPASHFLWPFTSSTL